VRSACRTPDHS